MGKDLKNLDKKYQEKIGLLLETQKYDNEIERICEHDKKDRSTWTWRQKQSGEGLIPVLKQILSDYSKRQNTEEVTDPVHSGGEDVVGGVSSDQDEDAVGVETASEQRKRLAAERKEKRLKAAQDKAAAASAAAIGVSAAAVQEAARSAAMVCIHLIMSIFFRCIMLHFLYRTSLVKPMCI